MIIYSQTHTLKDKQKHNQNNNRQKYVWGGCYQDPPDMRLVKILGDRY